MRRLVLAVLVLTALTGCGSSTDSGPSSHSEAWVKRVSAQLDIWRTQGGQIQAALKRRDFQTANAAILSLGESGQRVRTRFSDVPDDVVDAQQVFRDLVAAGDAAVAWALAIRTDPPPFTGDPQVQLRKGRKLADRAVAFSMAFDRTVRQINEHS
jgi:hypothetical protein